MESTDEQSSIIMVRTVGEGGGRGGVTVVEGKCFMLTLLCACTEVALHTYTVAGPACVLLDWPILDTYLI